jgi:hypothetical protein
MLKYCLLFLLILSGCATTPGGSVPPVEPTTYKADWPSGEYTLILDKALDDLGADLLAYVPKDMHSWCPTRRDSKAFYIMLFSALARFESNFKPNASYTESFKDSKGNYVVSRGLLQISKESANGYGCAIKDEKELHDPETNLRCGVRIAARWVQRDGVIQGKSGTTWQGMARYWSPFRKDDRISAIKAKTKAVCQ